MPVGTIPAPAYESQCTSTRRAPKRDPQRGHRFHTGRKSPYPAPLNGDMKRPGRNIGEVSKNTTIITIANSSSSSSSSSSVFFSITSWVVLRAGRPATHPQEGGAVNTCPPKARGGQRLPKTCPRLGGGRSPPGPPRDCQAGQCWTRLGRRLCSAPGGGVGGDGHRCWPWGATGAPLGPSITARKGGGSCGCDRGPKSTTPGSASQVAPCLV